MADTDKTDLAQLTVQLLSSYLSNNIVPREELAELIKTTRAALSDDALDPAPLKPEYIPAVSVRKSLASPDHILSLIDGKPYKMLKRHLAQHGLTPTQYRERYNLPHDYPMTAKAYSDERRATAARIGLGGRKPLAAPTLLPSATESVDAAATNVVPSAAPDPLAAIKGKSATTVETTTGLKRTGRRSKAQVKATSTEKSGVTRAKAKKVAPEAKAVSPAKTGSEMAPRKSAPKKSDEPLAGASPVKDDARSVNASPTPTTAPERPARKKPAPTADAAASDGKLAGRKPETPSVHAVGQKAEPTTASAKPAQQSASPSPAAATKNAAPKGRGKTASAIPPADPEKGVPAQAQPAKRARKTLKINTDA